MPDETRPGRDGFEDWLPLSAKRIAPGEYEIVDRSGRRLWYMEGASLAEWVCSTVNGASLKERVEAEGFGGVLEELCETAKATGEGAVRHYLQLAGEVAREKKKS